MNLNTQMLQKMSNTLRFLSADMIQKANSGHPGTPMGLSDIMAVFSSIYNHNPKNPKALNRDRLVFSGGHASALMYSLLHLWGYDLSLEDLKNFRCLDSKTPGHLEFGETSGVEITTGPLGQGIANSVGFALANKRAIELVGEIMQHKTYCFCGDGDLQEGISYEACSLAGHFKLDNLVLVYDCNSITIDGSTDLNFTENIERRFLAQNWSVTTIDGHDFEKIAKAFDGVQKANKPSLIIAKTKIGKGSVNLEGSPKVHGAPLGEEEIALSKKAASWSEEEFHIPTDVLKSFRLAIAKGELLEAKYNKTLENMPDDAKKLLSQLQNPPVDKISYPSFDDTPMATRDTNSLIMQAVAKELPGLLGGCADLCASNKTLITNSKTFPMGQNIPFGVREHAMAAITNAIANYGLFISFNSTFFVFSDYARASVRLAAMMGLKNIYIWTHDSIGVGEDGKTHQPIEHLTSLRAMPDLWVMRPADGMENAQMWKTALKADKTCAFVLSRQKLPRLDNAKKASQIQQGAYMLSETKSPQITLLASGSEVELALQTQEMLKKENINANVVSVPCLEIFRLQENKYKQKVINPSTKVLAIECASGYEWWEFADDVFAMNDFGQSAPYKEIYQKRGFTSENITKRAKELLKN